MVISKAHVCFCERIAQCSEQHTNLNKSKWIYFDLNGLTLLNLTPNMYRGLLLVSLELLLVPTKGSMVFIIPKMFFPQNYDFVA